MSTVAEKPVRQMPKGGRKGGSVFPRVALPDAVAYARKLVSKTHTGPQPKDVILSGVVGANSGRGEVRVSALKQYGFIKGDARAGYSADELATKIVAAPPEELPPLHRKAALKPAIFKKLFDTFHGDTVSKAKLKQRASDLKVHPDETSTCVDFYVSSMAFAGLVTIDGDQITHLASSELASHPPRINAAEPQAGEVDQDSDERSLATPANGTSPDGEPTAPAGETSAPIATPVNGSSLGGPRAVFNVNVTLDSSLDIEKLQRQLELLKRFGAI